MKQFNRSRRGLVCKVLLFAIFAAAQGAGAANSTASPLRLAVAGLVHGHVDGFLRAIQNRPDVKLAGIFEPDIALQRKYAKKYNLSESVFFADLESMLERTRPEAVAAFTNTYDHRHVVEVASERHIHVLMEKPLAVSREHALAIQRAAREGGIQVIVNYETTWYPSHGAIHRLFLENHAAGEIRKMVAMDGHEGPKEIGVGPEFLRWLTDPVKNGAGALFDFGCYGANLMTWMMDNQRPLAVTAMTQTVKPRIYRRVDDQATILLEYPGAQGIIQASWDWPFSRKDFEVYGETGYANAIGGKVLRVRLKADPQEQTRVPEALPPAESDSISYLKAVVRGKLKPTGLSSLENNMIVTEILVAARESARTGKRVKLR